MDFPELHGFHVDMKANERMNYPDLDGFRVHMCLCNGFLLFKSTLANPFTKETVKVPESPYQLEIIRDKQALGFYQWTNTYKPVHVTKSV